MKYEVPDLSHYWNDSKEKKEKKEKARKAMYEKILEYTDFGEEAILSGNHIKSKEFDTNILTFEDKAGQSKTILRPSDSYDSKKAINMPWGKLIDLKNVGNRAGEYWHNEMERKGKEHLEKKVLELQKSIYKKFTPPSIVIFNQKVEAYDKGYFSYHHMLDHVRLRYTHKTSYTNIFEFTFQMNKVNAGEHLKMTIDRNRLNETLKSLINSAIDEEDENTEETPEGILSFVRRVDFEAKKVYESIEKALPKIREQVQQMAALYIAEVEEKKIPLHIIGHKIEA